MENECKVQRESDTTGLVYFDTAGNRKYPHCWHSEPLQVRHAIGRFDGHPYSEDEQEYCCHCNKKSILKKKFGPHPDHGKFYKGPFSFSVERNIIDD